MELLKRVMLVDAFFHFTWPSLLKACIKVAMLPCIAENLMNYNTAWYTVNEWVGNCVHHFCLSMPCILHVYPSMPFYVACLSMPCSYIACLSMPFYVACLSMPFYVACLSMPCTLPVYPCHVCCLFISMSCASFLFIHTKCNAVYPCIWWVFFHDVCLSIPYASFLFSHMMAVYPSRECLRC